METKTGATINTDSELFVYKSDSSVGEGNETVVVENSVAEMKTSQIAGSFVTEDEVKASLAKKEENLDSLSLSPSGSCADGSLSQLSTLTKNSTLDDFNLNAIRNRQNELINSLKTNLDTSCLSIASDDINDEQPINFSTSTAISNDEFVSDAKDSSNTSTLREVVPPAAKFSQTLKHNSKDSRNQTEYEKAFASLNEILSCSTDPDAILDLYSSKLEAYKEEDNKKFDEIFSQIDNEKKFFFSIVEEDEIGELEDQINTISAGNLSVGKHSVTDDSISSINETLTPSQPTVVEPNSRKDEAIAFETTVVTLCDENKDPENLIIGEDEGDGEDFDEDVLLASDEEVDAEFSSKNDAREPNKVWKEFKSTDEEENRDNNDPKWEYLKNLGSDYERYKAVQARWNNLEIPNPKRDLTCRCRNVRRSKMYAEELRKNEYGKRMLCSPESDRRSAKRARRESCTVLFDWSIQQLIQDAENERSQIEKEQEQRLNELADQQSMDQLLAQQERKNEMFMREMKQRHYMEAESLIKDFRRRREELNETVRLKMEALRKAGDEVRQFHEFYPNKNGANGTHDANAVIYLTEVEVQEILEVEKMLIRYESFYSAPV